MLRGGASIRAHVARLSVRPVRSLLSTLPVRALCWRRRILAAEGDGKGSRADFF